MYYQWGNNNDEKSERKTETDNTHTHKLEKRLKKKTGREKYNNIKERGES